MNKTNKSFQKRLKVTRRGKVIARKPGQNHFNAKESAGKSIEKKRTQEVRFSKKVYNRFVESK